VSLSIRFRETSESFAGFPNLFPGSTVQGIHGGFFIDRKIEEAPAGRGLFGYGNQVVGA
jgi:hypothetical protein